MSRIYLDYINDILESINDIEMFVGKRTFEKFQKDKKTVNAVVRSLEIIGEAAKNIPKETRIANPVIPWAKMAGMRDKLSHEYFGIDVVLLWNTIKENLPPLKPLLTKIKEHEDKK